MKFPFQGSSVEALKRSIVSTLQRFAVLTFFLGALWFAGISRAQFSPTDTRMVRSVSGQFIVSATSRFSPLFYHRDFAVNTNFIRLEPTLLAVAAERFKNLLWSQLGLKPDSPWRGKIFLVVRPAQSPDDAVTIASGPILQAWDCRVTLPDVVTRTRYARSLAAALLLEIANRANYSADHSAEIPAWLADGLAQAALDEDVVKVILSTPARTVNGLPESNLDEKQRGLDPLASARRTLQNHSAFTFDQLSWPTDAQVNGDDGGVYLASAQLFVHELLGLDNGQKKMRAMLAKLPSCLNWQTAFFSAFQNDFQYPVDVEKWWSLRVIDFAAHNSGARWTDADSRAQLANLLSVPVDVRSRSNSLPVHAQISLQATIRSFAPARRDAILRTKLRDIELAQLRVARPFATLVAGYRAAIADFLGERKKSRFSNVNNRSSTPMLKRASAQETLHKLDVLDAQRRDLIAHAVPRNARSNGP